eukprot:12377169-Ditylum_brightwellii.AAC.1
MQRSLHIVHTYKKKDNDDAEHGNTYFDCGLCSCRNQSRNVSFMGIAVPDLYTLYLPISDEDEEFCYKAESLLLSSMKNVCPPVVKVCIYRKSKGSQHPHQQPKSNKNQVTTFFCHKYASYGQASLVKSSIKCMKYGQCITYMVQFHSNLPCHEKNIAPKM